MAPWTRKCWAMALSVPISTGDGVAMQHFAEIVNIFVSTLVGVDSEPSGISVGMGGAPIGQSSLDATAKLKLRTSDPVYSQSLVECVKSALARCSEAVGAQMFGQHSAAAGTPVMAQLQELLKQ